MRSLLPTCSTFSISMREIALMLRMCSDLACLQLWLRPSGLVAALHQLRTRPEADQRIREVPRLFIDHRLP